MIKNEDENELFNEKIMSIFDSDIPRRINFNSFINNTSGNTFNKKYYNDKPKENPISKFNPYDSEIDKKSKFRKQNEIRKINIDNDNKNIIFFGFNSGEKNEDAKLLIKNINNYINISSDEDYNINNKNSEINRDINNDINRDINSEINKDINNDIFNQNYITPKLFVRNNNEYSKLSQYSINNKKKDSCCTDLKNGFNNIRIKSTNFSSNLSYDSCDKNTNTYFNGKKEKNPFHKVNFININRNNKNKKKISKNETLIDNRKKKDIIEHNRPKKIPMLKSTIQLSKTLKTIDEYMELKKKKSKPKTHSKRKGKNNDKKDNLANNNESNKKDKSRTKNKTNNKDSKKKIINYKTEILNNDNQTNKNNNDKKINNNDKNINNEEKKEISDNKEAIKISKSIPKIKTHKNIFRSFLCCFECLSLENEDNNNFNKNQTNNNNIVNTDINDKLNDKKIKSKSKNKKKKK